MAREQSTSCTKLKLPFVAANNRLSISSLKTKKVVKVLHVIFLPTVWSAKILAMVS